MELSEHERRMLREMESQLSAEDPSLATVLSAHRLRMSARVVLAASGVVLGVLLMAVGISRAHLAGIAVALVGFLVLLASTTVGASCVQARRVRQPSVPKAAPTP